MQINFTKVNKKYQNLISKIYNQALNKTDNQLDDLMISISFVSQKKIKNLNKEHREIDKVTDVLSFPMLNIVYPQKLREYEEERNPDGTLFLGDIVICPKIAKLQAKYYNHSKEREIGFLALHGLLHLLGYDHIEKDDEEIMTKTSEEILQSLNIKRGE